MDKFFFKLCYVMAFFILTAGFEANALKHPEIGAYPTLYLWLLFFVVVIAYLGKINLKSLITKKSAKQWSYYVWLILIIVSILSFSAIILLLMTIPTDSSLTRVSFHVAIYGIPLVMILYPVTRVMDYLSE